MTHNSALGYIHKIMDITVSNRYFHTHFHGSVIHDSQKVEAAKVCMTDKCTNAMRYMHTMDYYSPLKRKETLTGAKTYISYNSLCL